VDAWLRVDRSVKTVASPRVGVRYVIGGRGATVLKASAGRFVGYAPLGAYGFGRFPPRRDLTLDPVSGRVVRAIAYSPVRGRLTLPRADGVALDLEHRLTRRLE